MGRALMIMSVCLVSVAAALLAGCGKEEVPPVMPPPVEADFSRSGPPAVPPYAGKAKPEVPKKPAGPKESATGAAEHTAAEVNAVVNYAVGVTPLQVKKRVEQRLDTIQRDHDRKLRNALNE